MVFVKVPDNISWEIYLEKDITNDSAWFRSN